MLDRLRELFKPSEEELADLAAANQELAEARRDLAASREKLHRLPEILAADEAARDKALEDVRAKLDRIKREGQERKIQQEAEMAELEKRLAEARRKREELYGKEG